MRMFNIVKLKEKYKIELSKEPKDDKKYIVVFESQTLAGYNCQRVFKGTYKECQKMKKFFEKRRRKLWLGSN